MPSQTFSASPQWSMVHGYGNSRPHVDAVDVDGVPLRIVPNHDLGLVTVNFRKPTAGTLTITGSSGGDGPPTVPVTEPTLGSPAGGSLR